jgi:hypothetical protein
MELILKTNNENSIAKIIALAKSLNVIIEERNNIVEDKNEKEELKKSIFNYRAIGKPSFGDRVEWQQNEREDRELPYSV